MKISAQASEIVGATLVTSMSLRSMIGVLETAITAAQIKRENLNLDVKPGNKGEQ